jgi:hypothetical protein
MQFMNEVHGRTVAQFDDCVGAQSSPQAPTDIEHAHVLVGRQVDPKIRVQRGGGDSLKDGATHPRTWRSDLNARAIFFPSREITSL